MSARILSDYNLIVDSLTQPGSTDNEDEDTATTVTVVNEDDVPSEDDTPYSDATDTDGFAATRALVASIQTVPGLSTTDDEDDA